MSLMAVRRKVSRTALHQNEDAQFEAYLNL